MAHDASPEGFDGLKVFSATKASDRAVLGERITEWLRNHRDLEITSKTVRQSSDAAFHCLSITLFFRAKEPASLRAPRAG